MLIEIHIVQNHSAANLNRDDTGSPKECVFGGVKRARISSQCLKRSIRRSDVFQNALGGHLGNRTRRLPELVRERLKAQGITDDVAEVAAKKVSGFGTKEGKEREPETYVQDGDERKRYDTAQTMFLTEDDIAAVTQTLLGAAQTAGSAKELDKRAAKDLQKESAQKGYRAVSVDVALFGRMITSEAFRDAEASCQVAHAMSTHQVEHEFDFFTAVDDLRDPTAEEEEDAGADMMGDVEFNGSCYYKYFSIDFQGLVDNLTGKQLGRRDVPEGDRKEAVELARAAVSAFLEAAVTVTPSGKQNSFAAHQLPSAVLVEVRPRRTPVSYANAFVDPARPGWTGSGAERRHEDLVDASLTRLKSEAEALTKKFNLTSSARLLLARDDDYALDGVESVPDLAALKSRVSEAVQYA
jgi:CRISPR system Cascade subunit CasC